MSLASSSRAIIRSVSRLPRQTGTGQIRKSLLQDLAQPSASFTLRTFNQRAQLARWPSISISHYSTSAFANAKPLNHSVTSQQSLSKQSSTQSKSENESSNESEEPDPDEPPKKASIRERLRFLTRRYGWWALGVYLLASGVDFSLIFLAIHLLGAEHIRELEDAVRNYLGMGKREMEDHEVAAWPVPASVVVSGQQSDGTLANNEEAAEKAASRLQGQSDVKVSETGEKNGSKKRTSGGSSSTLWTEAVLAYTIHKTLLLPFRVAFTAAVTPTFVKYMVRLGWAKNNAAVQQATQKAKMVKDAAKKALESRK